MVNAFNENKIDAVCASSIFLYSTSYADIKKHLSDKNIKVRNNN